MTMKLDLPYLMTDHDRSGKRRLYVRRHGRKIRIKEKLGTDAFARAYSEALEKLAGPTEKKRGTLGWLASCYFGSSEFRQLDPKSQATRRSIIEQCLREPRKPGSKDLMRDCPLS